MSIDLPIVENDRVSYSEVVRAEIIDIAPHLASVATFALHRTVNADAHIGKWSISNIETGANVGRADTVRECIAVATKKCADKTPGMVRRVYRKYDPQLRERDK